MPAVGFEFTISTGERPHSYALDRPLGPAISRDTFVKYTSNYRLPELNSLPPLGLRPLTKTNKIQIFHSAHYN